MTRKLFSVMGLLCAVASPTQVLAENRSAPQADSALEKTDSPALAPSFDLKDPARIEAGKKRFNQTCAAYCHGFEGAGGKAPSFKDRSDLSPQDAYKVISEGRRSADIMPPFGKSFSPEQIWELVAYIMHLGGQGPGR